MSISFKKLLFRHMESMIATFFLNRIYENRFTLLTQKMKMMQSIVNIERTSYFVRAATKNL